MKKISLLAISLLLIGLFIIICIYNSRDMSIKDIPEGEFLSQTESPNKKYKINFYLVNSHSTVDFAIRGELINTSGKSQNIYWAYHEDHVDSKWLNDNVIKINGKELNVEKDIYDWRYKTIE